MQNAPKKIALVAFLVASALLAPTLAGQDESAVIEFAFVNGVYEDLDPGLEPVRRGLLTLHIASPRHRLTVHGNRLTIARGDDGVLDVGMTVDFEGEGEIVVDVESAATTNRFEDTLRIPRQKLTVPGRVTVERRLGDGGEVEAYIWTVRAAPPSVSVTIESDVAGRLVTACDAFTRFLPMDCEALRRSLSEVEVPLPRSGEQFTLSIGRLTPEERAVLDRFLLETP